jgi:hypothetical protein
VATSLLAARRFTLFIVRKKLVELIERCPEACLLYLSLGVSACAFALGIWGSLTMGPTHLHQFGTGAFKDVTAGVQSIITAGAVVIGGCWTYFKFFRGRTFQPRLEVALAGEWSRLGTADVLQVRVTVTNIGASMVALNQFGTGLEIGFPADVQDRDEIIWDKVLRQGVAPPAARNFQVLTEHEWIEPAETIFEDLLLNLGKPPSIYILELTLLWGLSNKGHGQFCETDVEIFTRKIMSSDEKITDKVDKQ